MATSLLMFPIQNKSKEQGMHNTVVDPVTREVISGMLNAVTAEMQQTLISTSHSPIITEGQDATAAIFDTEGRNIAQATAVPVHLGVLVEMGKRFAAQYPEGVAEPGDIYVCNDPYCGGTHLPDIAVVAPVFYDDYLVGYVATMTHHRDIGGYAPGSVNVEARDLHAEGLRIPIVRLYHRGELNDSLNALLESNTRTPESLRGDLGAQIAACRTGLKRYSRVFSRWGRETIAEANRQLMDYAESLTRAEIGRINDGDFYFEDWLDDDGLDPANDPLKIAVTLRVRGDEIEFDFTGTDPQATSAINNVPSSTNAVVFYAVRLLTGDRIPNNDGCYRPIRTVLPAGTLVSANYPAPVAARGMSLKRIEDVVLGAMIKAVPEFFTAAHSGQYTMVTIAGQDPETGRALLGHIGGPYAGGHGARPRKDGIDVTEHGATNGSPIPLEVAEAKLPLLFRQCSLWTDSGGAGRNRGGLGYHVDVEWRGPAVYAQLRRERMKFKPWGALGGSDAPLCSTEFFGIDGSNEELPGKCRRALIAGDRLSIYTTGGGGYGNPRERDRIAVENDVIDGKVSVEAAKEVYGYSG
ncbi:hydantoinase B/oxoprolinase family protein [Parahaliea aestuarii]